MNKPTNKIINFYSTRAAYGCFSNFAPYPISINGKEWRTVEHYFQAQKYPGTNYEEAIRLAPTATQAVRMSWNKNIVQHKRSDWDEVKDNVMRHAVLAKFQQHEAIRQRLLETGDAVLVEHTERDAYWGDGGDGSGKNMLGKILMEVRKKLATNSD